MWISWYSSIRYDGKWNSVCQIRLFCLEQIEQYISKIGLNWCRFLASAQANIFEIMGNYYIQFETSVNIDDIFVFLIIKRNKAVATWWYLTQLPPIVIIIAIKCFAGWGYI